MAAGPIDEAATRSYYDDFADWYERERGRGYHRMLDDLEFELVARYGRGRRILEVGCGTGLILQRADALAALATGVDLSAGMLARARERGLLVVQGSATALPHADDSFDLVYAFKVLAHVGDIRTAMAEMARVTRPGGRVLAEFYNRRSLRYLIKRLKQPSAVSATTTDEQVYTRYDSLATMRSYLPERLRYERVRGVRIITPVSYVHNLPAIGPIIRRTEATLADAPLARALGGFSIVIARKV